MEEKATKVEVLVDGKLIKIFTDTLSLVECDLSARELKGEQIVTLLVYDRFLNCSTKEEKISVG